ncbi:hypothetical protein CHARACLAT_031804 [Characodon lateralis]|uniref:Uncharacterized protein n=1 Tax=Characodon lateralis TaxID=208331 RepID=A0ABU7CUZ8_9TELE|nr:hypothetical protein [Characodon lateralis]
MIEISISLSVIPHTLTMHLLLKLCFLYFLTLLITYFVVCARLQELIRLRNVEQKHEPLQSLLLDIDLRIMVKHLNVGLICPRRTVPEVLCLIEMQIMLL